MTYTSEQITAAIDSEAEGWAIFFGVSDSEGLEARKLVMRANVSVGYLEPLLPYLVRSTEAN